MPVRSDDTWFLHDAAAGHRQQAAALARALVPDPRGWELHAAPPWAWVSPRRLPGAERAFGAAFADALRAPPALAIGCGRRAALATRLLRERGARVVQVLHPRIDTVHWDLVVAPEHDGLRGPNVLTLCGSLHPVDDAWLAQARAAMPALTASPGPRTTVLLGGPTAAVRFDRMAFDALAAQVERWRAQDGGSLFVVGSRRTPPEFAALARSRWADTPGLRWFDAGDGPNPYATALAVADRIVVSPDSVNMISEACATAAPVFVAAPERARGRVRAYLDAMLRRGRIRPLGPAPDAFAAEPLRETARIAALVRERLGLR